MSSEFDMPVDPDQVRRVMERVAIERPLRGGRKQDITKNPYSMPSTKPSLKAARKDAEALIQRRLLAMEVAS